MSARPTPFACARTDAVLALHLDGDVEQSCAGESGYTFVCGETLQSHLRECGSCQSALRRARRLDAALAQAAGRSAADHDEDGGMRAVEQRWFTAVEVASRAPAVPTPAVPTPAVLAMARHVAVAATTRGPARREGATAWLLFAAAASVIFAATWALLEPIVAAPMAANPGEPGAASQTIVADIPPTRAPSAPDRQPSPTMTADAFFTPASIRRLKRERRLDQPTAGVGPGVGPGDQWRSLTPKQLQRLCEDRAIDPGQRMRAAEVLADAGRPHTADAAVARGAWIELLASCSDRTAADSMLHAELLDRTRNTPHLIAELRTRLARIGDNDSSVGGGAVGGGEIDGSADGDSAAGSWAPTLAATLVVATRIGDRDLDLGVRRAVRRTPALTTAVIAACRSGQRARGAGNLLLALWQDLGARSDAGDDAAVAELWFQGQPPTVFAEVLALLQSSRSSPQRQRCLLALGHASDESTLATLLHFMSSAQRSDAFTAAFALANLPHAVLGSLMTAANDNDAWLLRAALARAGLPAARPWLDALLLRPDEATRFGRATLIEFPEVASWFRDRGPQLGD